MLEKFIFHLTCFCTGRVSFPRETHVRHIENSFKFPWFVPATYSDYCVRIITSARWWKRMQLWIQLKYHLFPSAARRWRPLLLPERSQRDLSPWYSLSSKSDLLTLLSWTEWRMWYAPPWTPFTPLKKEISNGNLKSEYAAVCRCRWSPILQREIGILRTSMKMNSISLFHI